MVGLHPWLESLYRQAEGFLKKKKKKKSCSKSVVWELRAVLYIVEVHVAKVLKASEVKTTCAQVVINSDVFTVPHCACNLCWHLHVLLLVHVP